MKTKVILTPSQPYKQVQVAWSGVAGMAIMNNTSYSLLIREGAQERPDIRRYDYLVPPGQHIILPVVAHEFGLALDVQAPSDQTTYFQPASVIFFDGNEVIPDFGSGGYRENIHIAHSLDVGGIAWNVLDCRASRALFMSIKVNTGASEGDWFPAYVDFYTTPEPTATPAIDGKLIKHVSLHRINTAFEVVVPLSANYVYLLFANSPMGAFPIDIDVDIALLDSVPYQPPVDPYAVARVRDLRFEIVLPGGSAWAEWQSHIVRGGSKWVIRHASVSYEEKGTARSCEAGITILRGNPADAAGETMLLWSLQQGTTTRPFYAFTPLNVVAYPGDFVRFYARNNAGTNVLFSWALVIDELDL